MTGDSSGRPELEREDVHDVLSNERRQIALSYLNRAGGRASPSELADCIAVAESGEDPPPDNVRQSAYVTLRQTHIPKLVDLGIVEFDDEENTVSLTDRFGQVNVFLETVPRYGVSWSEVYLAIATLGLLLLLASWMGVPLVSAVDSATWGVAAVLVIGASAVYQSVSQGSPLIERLYGPRY